MARKKIFHYTHFLILHLTIFCGVPSTCRRVIRIYEISDEDEYGRELVNDLNDIAKEIQGLAMEKSKNLKYYNFNLPRKTEPHDNQYNIYPIDPELPNKSNTLGFGSKYRTLETNNSVAPRFTLPAHQRRRSARQPQMPKGSRTFYVNNKPISSSRTGFMGGIVGPGSSSIFR